MAMMAHADDMEVYAGGTMAKFTSEGYEGVLALLTPSMAGAKVDERGYRKVPPGEAMAVRDREVEEAARVLGVSRVERLGLQNTLYSDGRDFVWLGDADFQAQWPGLGPLLPAVAINPELIRPVVEVIRRFEPEIVICQHMTSGFEHVCAGHVVNLAFRQAMEQGVSLGQLWLPVAVRHCTWASDLRIYPTPNVLIDITAFWEKKARAMLCHKSQRLDDAVEKVRLVNRYWGMARQCDLAEPFFTLCDARYR
jgi:LmbE family N-acetylglucosaminyl deacetylase